MFERSGIWLTGCQRSVNGVDQLTTIMAPVVSIISSGPRCLQLFCKVISAKAMIFLLAVVP